MRLPCTIEEFARRAGNWSSFLGTDVKSYIIHFFLSNAWNKPYNSSMSEERHEKGSIPRKKWIRLIALLGGLALVVAAVGIYFVSGGDEPSPSATNVSGKAKTVKKAKRTKKERKKKSREQQLQTDDESVPTPPTDEVPPADEAPSAEETPPADEAPPADETPQPVVGEEEQPSPSPTDEKPVAGDEPVSNGEQAVEDTAEPTGETEPVEGTTEAVEEEPSTDQSAAEESTSSEDTGNSDGVEPPAEPTPKEAPVASPDFPEKLLLYGGGSETVEQREIWQRWMERMISDAKASELVPMLEARVREIAPKLITGERLNYASYKNSRLLMNAVELCYMAKLVGAERLDSFMKVRGEASRTSPKEFMQWLLTDRSRPLHRLLHAFAFNSGKAEEFPRTLKVFYVLWERASERERVRYMNLAIACSLVRSEVAHGRGMLRMPDEHLLDIPELYDYYRTQDVANMLLTNIWKLGVTELLHVVDVRLPMSEFEWVKKKLDYQRQNWGATYSSIEYIMERATQKVDPYKLYTFEEIKEEGGVCRDRAYFCAASAKTRGLPAVIITGDGERGPHAWVALYTSDKGGWTITGSYGYKTGRFEDPCSGLMLHESVLLDKDPKLTPEKQEPAGDCMVLSDYLCLLDSKQEALGCARYVTLAFPQLTSSWQNYVKVMEKCGSKLVSTNAWLRLYLELGHQSKKNMELMDLAQYVQANHVMEGKRDNVKMNALKQSSRKLGELIQAGRTDLAIESMERQTKIYADRCDYRGLASFFKSAFKDYGSLSYTFGEMLDLYIRMLEICTEKLEGDQETDDKAKKNTIRTMWRTCAKEAESTFSKMAFSKNDFFVIQKDADIMHNIAECWRLGGDDKRAQRLEMNAEQRLQESRMRSVDKKIEQEKDEKQKDENRR